MLCCLVFVAVCCVVFGAVVLCCVLCCVVFLCRLGLEPIFYRLGVSSVDFCSFGWLLGGLWGGLGGSWAALGGVLEGLGAVLDRSWVVLGRHGSLRVIFNATGSCGARRFDAQRGAKMEPKWDPRRTEIEDKNEDEKRCS